MPKIIQNSKVKNCILYLVLSIKYKELKSQNSKLKTATQNSNLNPPTGGLSFKKF